MKKVIMLVVILGLLCGCEKKMTFNKECPDKVDISSKGIKYFGGGYDWDNECSYHYQNTITAEKLYLLDSLTQNDIQKINHLLRNIVQDEITHTYHLKSECVEEFDNGWYCGESIKKRKAHLKNKLKSLE